VAPLHAVVERLSRVHVAPVGAGKGTKERLRARSVKAMFQMA